MKDSSFSLHYHCGINYVGRWVGRATWLSANYRLLDRKVPASSCLTHSRGTYSIDFWKAL